MLKKNLKFSCMHENNIFFVYDICKKIFYVDFVLFYIFYGLDCLSLMGRTTHYLGLDY